MFYCPNCNNTYDIARTSTQIGGDFGLSTTDSEMLEGGANLQNLFDKILKDQVISLDDVKGIDMKNMVKSMEYKKLTKHEKEKIYNKIQDILPKDKKKIIENKPHEVGDENLAFFVCSNCGYSIKIKEGTKIFSRTSDNLSQSYATGDYSDMLNSNILPRTRKYVCQNDKCESHKNPVKREAVFFRKNNSKYNFAGL